ncbi:hypothetical protein JWG44_17835 [Leptospira sp. 201903071]|uniref:hypothetical protein n=1 Tax=Leptospira ainazelensis TaxID=2810034 RepID=UPI00196376DB|nr:hypothetical protein [Leptospira ainazelensis]MBM9502122.1 hypothetical protein [Leptospira ainazelensis]
MGIPDKADFMELSSIGPSSSASLSELPSIQNSSSSQNVISQGAPEKQEGIVVSDPIASTGSFVNVEV